MIKDCKICGISDADTLNFIINHPLPPKFIGFISNYAKSSRNVEINKLKKLLNVNKNKSEFVAVLVKPNNKILEEIKTLPFDYYQLYDCTPDEIKSRRTSTAQRCIRRYAALAVGRAASRAGAPGSACAASASATPTPRASTAAKTRARPTATATAIAREMARARAPPAGCPPTARPLGAPPTAMASSTARACIPTSQERTCPRRSAR